MTKAKPHIERRPPVLALDLGEKTVGVAVSDELSITIKRLDPLKRSNWKELLRNVANLIERFDAKTLVIGLPLSLDGVSRSAAEQVEKLALNFARSLRLPVYLQDERLTSQAARESLQEEGYDTPVIERLIDSEAARIILRDFLNNPDPVLAIAPESKLNDT